jgi:hypothetical protein
MVFLAEKPSLRLASCCRVEVVAAALLALDVRDPPVGKRLQPCQHRPGLVLGAEGEFVELLAVECVKSGEQPAFTGRELGIDRPVFPAAEGLDLGLALADQAQCH